MGWREHVGLIRAILIKDLRMSVVPFIVVLVIAGVLGFLLGPAALSASRFGPTRFVWFEFLLLPMYAISSLLTAVIMGLVFYRLHAGEVQKGTIRSIILYPVDMNDITIAKLLSSLLVTAILSSILFFGPLASFFFFGVYPFADFLALHLTTLLVAFACATLGAFASHLLARWTGRMVLSPSAMAGLVLIGSILLTELALTQAGWQIAILSARSRDTFPTQAELQGIADLAEGISTVSLHHWGARGLSVAFGIYPASFGDALGAVPLGVLALVLIVGFLAGKRTYLDVFVR